MTQSVREQVRKNYANAARSTTARVTAAEPEFELASTLYESSDIEELPAAAAEGSLGCGNPVAVADLRPGETVLDLGSGGGIDVLLSARRVGPTGFAYGLDMTDEMLKLARANAAEAGAGNVNFLKGYMEDIPLPDASVDVVISNCVINLSDDKNAVFAEIVRVLRPGGRVGVTDVVADDALTPEERKERGSWVGCIAGAPSFTEYRQGLESAGLTDVEIVPTHQMTQTVKSEPAEGDCCQPADGGGTVQMAETVNSEPVEGDCCPTVDGGAAVQMAEVVNSRPVEGVHSAIIRARRP